MRPAKKRASSKASTAKSEEYEKFEALTKALVSVPKSEIQRESRRTA